MSSTVGMARDLAKTLAGLGIGVWDDEGMYADNQWGFVIGALPTAPNKLIGLNPYVVSTDAEPGVDVMGFQFRVRSGSRDPRPALDIVDQLLDTLHGIENVQLGGLHVPLIWRNSMGDLGLDESGRYEIVDNYYMYVDRRSAN